MAAWRGRSPLLQVFLHRLDHHDGVVHHQARGQHQAQQGELVDREAEDLDEGEGADQGDRNGQAGHHRGPPILQKDEQDDQHQHDRQPEGIHHPLDRRLDELADVVDLEHLHSRGHGLGELVHHLHHLVRDIESIALGGLKDRDGDRGIALDAHRLLGVAVGAVGGLAHILETKQVAGGRAADDQVVEILDGHQIAVVLHQNGIGELLISAGWRTSHQATDGHAVLTGDRTDDLISSEIIGRELVGVNEQPEGRITTSEKIDGSDTRDPLELIIQILVDQAIEIGGIKLPLRGGHLVSQQNRRGALHHRYPCGLNLLGQLGHRQRHPVLDVDLVDIDIRSFVEIDLNRACPRHGAGGRDVVCARHPIDLLLDGIGHRLLGDQ